MDCCAKIYRNPASLLLLPSSSLLPGLLLGLLLLTPASVLGETYRVSPDGTSDYYISRALDLAQPGDTVFLEDGNYTGHWDQGAIRTVRDGTEDMPITIEGSANAVIKGSMSGRAVHVLHNYIHLRGFTVDGKSGDGVEKDDYTIKGVFVYREAASEGDPLYGFVMEDLTVRNIGAECVRLKHFVRDAEVVGNHIESCGVFHYQFPSSEKNGEGIYVGTSSEQWKDGIEDKTTGNYIAGNYIATNGNECVDLKEGTSDNIVEDNTCVNQLDNLSACYDSRGDKNTIRFNFAKGCLGAGVRLGGHKVGSHQFGVYNNVYGNELAKVEEGALDVEFPDQGEICANVCDGNVCGVMGAESVPAKKTWNRQCESGGGATTRGTTSTFTSPTTSTATNSSLTLVATSSASSTTVYSDGSASSESPSTSLFADSLMTGSESSISATTGVSVDDTNSGDSGDDKEGDDAIPTRTSSDSENDKDSAQLGDDEDDDDDDSALSEYSISSSTDPLNTGRKNSASAAGVSVDDSNSGDDKDGDDDEDDGYAQSGDNSDDEDDDDSGSASSSTTSLTISYASWSTSYSDASASSAESWSYSFSTNLTLDDESSIFASGLSVEAINSEDNASSSSEDDDSSSPEDDDSNSRSSADDDDDE